MALDSLLRGKLQWILPVSLDAVVVGTLFGFYATNGGHIAVPLNLPNLKAQQAQIKPTYSRDALTDDQLAELTRIMEEQPLERTKADYSGIGMNVGDIRHYSKQQLEQLALDLQAHGVTSVRVEIVPDLQGYGYFFNSLTDKRMSVLALLNLNLVRLPPAAINDKSDLWTEQYIRAVQRFLDTYGNKVDSIQILNEPNDNAWVWSSSGGRDTQIQPEAYANILKKAYTLIKRFNPDISVVTGGLLPPTALGTDYNPLKINTEEPKDPIVWLNAVLEASNGEANFDMVAVHPYVSLPDLIGHLNLYRQNLDGRGMSDKGIMVTEAGYSAGNSLDGEAEQARHMLAYLNLAMNSAAKRVYIFTWKDFPVIGEANVPETIKYGVFRRPSGALLHYFNPQ